MAVKLFQIIKLIETIQLHQNDQRADRNQVRRDFEFREITKGLEYPDYDANETFCVESGILKFENDEIYFTKLGIQLIADIDDIEKFKENLVQKCFLKNNFSEIIIPMLVEFHEGGENKLWYEKKAVVNLFQREDLLPIIYEIGLLIKNDSEVILNPNFQKNEIIQEQRKTKRKISQANLEKSLLIQKKVGQIAERIVLKFEKARLLEGGFLEKSEKVEQISEDWANKGYDIESFDGPGDEILPDRFIEVKGTTGKNFSIFWSVNEIENAKMLREKYWIYFVSGIDIENDASPEIPEMIQDPFIKIDPFSSNNENNNFNKKFESIHVTKNDDEK